MDLSLTSFLELRRIFAIMLIICLITVTILIGNEMKLQYVQGELNETDPPENFHFLDLYPVPF